MIRIALDAMGGDHGPPVVVGGIADYLKRHGGEGVRFLVHGDEEARALHDGAVAIGERHSVPRAHVALLNGALLRIVRDMEGSVAIQSPADPASGRGTRVLVSLPRATTPGAD